MKVKLGFSFCPNDTFIFFGIATEKVEIEGLEIEPLMADVEELNKLTIENKIDICKISIQTLIHIKDNYHLLSCGGAFGKNEAPVVVSLKERKFIKSVAVPGKNTTAFLLFKRFFPTEHLKIEEMRYDEIIPAVLKGKADAGILIHEGRFTYKDYGLKLLMDLKDEWKKRYNLPIPLGGVVVKKELLPFKERIEKSIRESIMFACHNRELVWDYIKEYAKEMEDEIIEKHLKAFVNEYTVDIGSEGIKAIETLLGIKL